MLRTWEALFGGLLSAGLLSAFEPVLPWFVGIVVFLVVARTPLPGRGPGILTRRDEWRRFKGQARRDVMARAGNRCEGSVFLAWGRCPDDAQEADHVYPWSKGGPTVVGNGQALCRGHNRSKSNMTPPWWYVLTLERRRRRYFPAGVDGRVSADLTAADRQVRAAWNARRPAR